MPTVQCPQCGTSIEKGSVEFCPNPTCGYPLSFLETEQEEQVPRAMERKPGDTAPMQQAPSPTPTPRPQAPPPMPMQPPMQQASPPSKGKSKLPIFLGLGVLLIAGAVVAVLLLTGKDDGESRRGGDADPTETENGDSNGGDTLTLSWQPLLQPAFAGTGNQVIRAVTAGFKVGPGQRAYLAAGVDTSAGNADAAAWLSEDGATWERSAGDGLTGSGDQEINGLTIAGRRILAVGSDTSGGDTDAAVWATEDGQTWERIGSDALGGEGNQTINRVAGSPFGQVAVGLDTASGSADAAIWISEDGGDSWARVEDPNGELGGPGDQVIRRVQKLETGVFTGLVAVGYDTSGGSDAAVWVSSDGADWIRVPDDDGVLGGEGDQQMLDLTVAGETLVGVGFDSSSGSRNGAVWLSEGGTEWELVEDPDSVLGGDGDQILTRVVSPAAGEQGDLPLLIAGGVDASGGDEDGAIWYSADGETWTRDREASQVFGGAGAQRIESITSGDDSLVAVGSDASREDTDAAAWTGTPAG